MKQKRNSFISLALSFIIVVQGMAVPVGAELDVDEKQGDISYVEWMGNNYPEGEVFSDELADLDLNENMLIEENDDYSQMEESDFLEDAEYEIDLLDDSETEDSELLNEMLEELEETEILEEESEDEYANEETIAEESIEETQDLLEEPDLTSDILSGKIYTAEDLKAIANNLSGSYTLMNDIELSGQWVPIGTKESPFKGSFNGNGHIIKNIRIGDGLTNNSDYQGLFGMISGANITRLTVTGSVSGSTYVGGIAGYIENSTITYCINRAAISGINQTGGVVGRIYKSSVDYCMNDGDITCSVRGCGGVAADIYPSGGLTNCLNLGDVSGGTDLTGGIVGGSTSGTVSGCINAAEVCYQKGRAGAIAGDNASYAGKRSDNYFLKTSDINAGFSSVGSGSGVFLSINDERVIALKNAIIGGNGVDDFTVVDPPIKTEIKLSAEKTQININEPINITAHINTQEGIETVKEWKWSAKLDDSTETGLFYESSLTDSTENNCRYLYSTMFSSYIPGKYTISLSDDQGNMQSLKIEVNEFNLLQYQAEHYLNSDAEASAEAMLLINRSPSRELYETGKNRGLTSKAKAWNLFANCTEVLEDASTITDVPFELKGFYVSLLINILEVNSTEDATGYLLDEGYGMAKTLLDTLDTLGRCDASFANYMNFDFKKMPEVERNRVIKTTKDNFERVNRYSIAALDISEGIDLVKDYHEWCELMESFYIVSKLHDSYLEILKSMQSKCNIIENPDLYYALGECIQAMTANKSGMWEITLNTWRDAEAGKLIAKAVISKMWDDVKNTAVFSNPVLAAFYAGYKYGMFMSNTFFSTNTLAEKTLKLEMIVEIEDLLRDVYNDSRSAFINSRSEEDAKVFLDTITLLFECFDEDCKVAYDFTETADNAFITTIYKQLKKSPQELMESITNIMNSMQVFQEAVFKDWIYQLETEDLGLYERFKYSVFRDLTGCTISGLDQISFKYTGSPIEPDVVIKDDKETLVREIDYYLEYKNNINAGNAAVIIHGMGDYVGDIEKKFKIEPAFNLSILESTLKPGQTSTISVAGIDSGDSIVSWESADPSIVTVNSSGIVNAISPGTTVITVALASGLTFEMTVTVAQKLFSDVTDSSQFYYEPIYWAVDTGITTGWADNTFRPNNTCNRVAVVTFLWRLAGEPKPKTTATFRDMTGNSDFDQAISWAMEQGITTGWSEDNTFRPWATCNRVAIVTFLWRYAGRPEPASMAAFKDLTGTADFDKAISWAAENDITTGYNDNTFRPWNQCLRLAIVSFLYRYAKL